MVLWIHTCDIQPLKLYSKRLVSPLVADSLTNIGIVYGNKGDRAAATEMYTKAYHIYLKKLGPDHPETQGLKPFVNE